MPTVMADTGVAGCPPASGPIRLGKRRHFRCNAVISHHCSPHAIHHMHWADPLLYKLLPGSCVTCGCRTGRHLDICQHCESDLPWLNNACPRCGLPLASAAALCLACLHRMPLVEASHSAFHYAFPVDRLIQRFKNNRNLAYGRVLSTLLGQHLRQTTGTFLQDNFLQEGLLQESSLQEDSLQEGSLQQSSLQKSKARSQTLLVPTPLHPKKQRGRGFNQSGLIAETLSGMFNIKVTHRHLIRTRPTGDQKRLSAAERKRNVAGAFSLRQPFNGERIILVDDVITTGATTEEMAKCLRLGGAGSVSVVSLAHTPPAHRSSV